MLLKSVPQWHFCAYNILMSSVIYYWADARQHRIYLLIRCTQEVWRALKKLHVDLLLSAPGTILTFLLCTPSMNQFLIALSTMFLGFYNIVSNYYALGHSSSRTQSSMLNFSEFRKLHICFFSLSPLSLTDIFAYTGISFFPVVRYFVSFHFSHWYWRFKWTTECWKTASPTGKTAVRWFLRN